MKYFIGAPGSRDAIIPGALFLATKELLLSILHSDSRLDVSGKTGKRKYFYQLTLKYKVLCFTLYFKAFLNE
jgi:hypothetical protein